MKVSCSVECTPQECTEVIRRTVNLGIDITKRVMFIIEKGEAKDPNLVENAFDSLKLEEDDFSSSKKMFQKKSDKEEKNPLIVLIKKVAGVKNEQSTTSTSKTKPEKGKGRKSVEPDAAAKNSEADTEKK